MEVVKYLLEKGAKVSLRNNNKDSAETISTNPQIKEICKKALDIEKKAAREQKKIEKQRLAALKSLA